MKTIYPEAGRDYATHKDRINFEEIRESGNVDRLMNFVEAFIRRGHNPHDPKDEMYAIMGISPDYLDFLKHDMAEKKLADTDVFFNKAAKTPNPAPATGHQGHGHGHGRGKTQKHGFGPEDEI